MEFESEERCTAAAFLRSGAAAVAAYHDGSMRLFDLDSVNIKWSCASHATPVVGIGMSTSGELVLAVSRDGTMTVTAAASGELQAQTRDLIDVMQGQPVDSFVVSPDGALCAAAWSRGFAVCSAPWQGGSLRTHASYSTLPPESAVQVRRGRCDPLCALPHPLSHAFLVFPVHL